MHPALDGAVVVELASAKPIQFCGYLLAQLGARVYTVVEDCAPGPDSAIEIIYAKHLAKHKIEIRLSQEEIDLWLSDRVGSDSRIDAVLVDAKMAWRPSLQALRKATKASILAITPFGLSGPDSDGLGGDLIASHAGGYAYYASRTQDIYAGDPPVRGPGEQAHLFAGLIGAVSVVGVVVGRSRGARSRLLDLSEQEAIASLLCEEVGEYNRGLLQVGRGQSPAMVAGGLVITLPCRDGHVMISPREEHQWRRLVELAGNPEWASRSEFQSADARLQNWRLLQQSLSDWSSGQDKAHLFRLAQSKRIACFPVNPLSEARSIGQLEYRDFWERTPVAELDLSVDLPSFPAHFITAPDATLPAETVAPAGQSGMRRQSRQTSLPPAAGNTESALLTGVRVLDFSWVVGGPACTKYLALMGAEVIKIESSTRLEHRNRAGWADILNTSKLSVTVDLHTTEGVALVKDLATMCDVVVENFSTGVMARLGLSYEELSKSNRSIVYLSLSGMGRTGPDSGLVAYGSLLQAYSGWIALMRGAESSSLLGASPAWTDQVAGAMGALAILAALWRRQSSGLGTLIDLSMLECVMSLQISPLIALALSGRDQPPAGNSSKVYAPHGCFPCSGDDEWIVLAAYTDSQWAGLVEAMGRPEWTQGLDTAARRSRWSTGLNKKLAEWTRGWNATDLVRLLRVHRVPTAASASLWTMLNDPHLAARGYFHSFADGALTLGLPWIDSRTGRGTVTPAPRMGQHNDQVFLDLLGLDPKEYRALGQRVVR